MIPVIDGLQVCRQIRSDPKLKEKPVSEVDPQQGTELSQISKPLAKQIEIMVAGEKVSGKLFARPVTAQGKVKGAVLEARARGVLFDIGHGKGSFAFKTARAMLANGFPPDTISSDVHKLCIDGPAFDQVTTMSKFLCLGMPLPEVVRASTVNAAMALKRPELGTLKPGAVGDATVAR